MKRLLTTLLLAAAALPAAALVPDRVEVEYTVGMPLAVTEVVEVGVPAPQVEQVVYRLNTAQVPIVESVEIVRYTAFPVVVERYQPAQPVYFEPQGLDVEWDLDGLDMLTLLAAHLDAGLQGQLLADAVLRDVALLGFDVGVDGRLYRAPRPVRRDFLYYVEPGYRFTTDRGLFRQRVVVVADDDFVEYRQRRRVRFRDRDRVVWRDRIVDRDRVVRERAVPPGHAKHGPGGPQPTPGHVKHAGPGGPPGHSGDGVVRERDDDRRRVDRDRGERPRRRAERRDDRGRGNDEARGNPGRGQGQGKAKGKDKDKDKGDGKGKGRGR